MDPHPLANLFKRSNSNEPIVSELNSLDYLYEVLLELRESENCDEEIYKVIHDSSLNEKHDCNDFTINFINVNCVNDMQNPKLGNASFAMSTTCCNDHDWGDSIYLSPMMNMRLIIVFAIILKVGLEECQLYIPRIWRMFNLMKFLIKVGLERS